MLGSVGGAIANPTQVMENLPSSLVAMASSLGRSANGKLEPAYGLVFSFHVAIDGILADLGRWQSCSGLRMDFNPVPMKSGGSYTGPQYLAGEVSYPKIVLKRAVDSKSADAVQRWLAQEAVAWINGTAKEQASTAKINLHDSAGKVVLTWTVSGVRPSSWAGPDLDANSSKVAIETLELVHEGFRVQAPSSAGGSGPTGGQAGAGDGGAPKVDKLTLTEKEGEKRPVTFANNPQRVTVERTTQPLTLQDVAKSGNEGSDPPIGNTVNTTQLRMYDLFIVDKPVQAVDLLIEWMDGEKDKANPTDVKLPPLTLSWGSFEKPVTLTFLSAEYNRFGTDGVPTRAKVTVGVTVSPVPKPPKTNPSSGGIPGRSAHTMVLGENLPLLAKEHYGSPARWRELAEANGIDDPLRGRPGSRLFLPAASELTAKG